MRNRSELRNAGRRLLVAAAPISVACWHCRAGTCWQTRGTQHCQWPRGVLRYRSRHWTRVCSTCAHVCVRPLPPEGEKPGVKHKPGLQGRAPPPTTGNAAQHGWSASLLSPAAAQCICPCARPRAFAPAGRRQGHPQCACETHSANGAQLRGGEIAPLLKWLQLGGRSGALRPFSGNCSALQRQSSPHRFLWMCLKICSVVTGTSRPLLRDVRACMLLLLEQQEPHVHPHPTSRARADRSCLLALAASRGLVVRALCSFSCCFAAGLECRAPSRALAVSERKGGGGGAGIRSCARTPFTPPLEWQSLVVASAAWLQDWHWRDEAFASKSLNATLPSSIAVRATD